MSLNSNVEHSSETIHYDQEDSLKSDCDSNGHDYNRTPSCNRSWLAGEAEVASEQWRWLLLYRKLCRIGGGKVEAVHGSRNLAVAAKASIMLITY